LSARSGRARAYLALIHNGKAKPFLDKHAWPPAPPTTVPVRRAVVFNPTAVPFKDGGGRVGTHKSLSKPPWTCTTGSACVHPEIPKPWCHARALLTSTPRGLWQTANFHYNLRITRRFLQINECWVDLRGAGRTYCTISHAKFSLCYQSSVEPMGRRGPFSCWPVSRCYHENSVLIGQRSATLWALTVWSMPRVLAKRALQPFSDNPALQQFQKFSKSASTTPQRPIWNTEGTVGVRHF